MKHSFADARVIVQIYCPTSARGSGLDQADRLHNTQEPCLTQFSLYAFLSI